MSNKFKFSLEKLLEMRKTREEEGKKLFNSSQ
ncbi:MAG: flagellar export protein FliJ, partial [Clostridium sp.]|nr:flagellar export protein FliJ [Clostridium sp.]